MIFDIKCGELLRIENPDNETEVIIPDGVTEIGAAFYEDHIIEKVVIPDSVEVIQRFAFEGCDNLSEVVFGKGLQTIEADAFKRCKALKEIELYDGLEQIDSEAFRGSGVERIILPSSIWQIEPNTFFDTPWWEAQQGKEFVMPCPWILLQICSDKSTIKVPDGVVYIASNVFAPETARVVRELIIPDSVVYIAAEAFCNSALRSVHLGEDVSYIGVGAFENCIHLEEINFPESVMYIDKIALKDTAWEKKHKQGLIMLNSHLMLRADLEAEKIELPEGIVEIASFAFENSNAECIVLPSSLRSIGMAFIECNKLRSIVFKEGIEYLDEHFISEIENVERIVIPSTVKEFCNYFGYGCSRLLVELHFTVAEKITEVMKFSEAQFSGETYIAPHIPITAMLDLSESAARGFMKYTLDGGRYDEELIDGYKQYIVENRTEYYNQICKYPFVLNYLCEERLIPAEEIDDVLDIVKDDVEQTALLLAYSEGQKRTDYDV